MFLTIGTTTLTQEDRPFAGLNLRSTQTQRKRGNSFMFRVGFELTIKMLLSSMAKHASHLQSTAIT